MVELGDKVKDRISGFTGIAYGRTAYLNGCISVGIRAEKLQDGKILDLEWIDESQLDIVKSKSAVALVRKTGGPAPIPKSLPIPNAK